MNAIETALSQGRCALSEHESKKFLRLHGIPVTREREVHNAEDLKKAIVEIGFPLVVKAGGPGFNHKTEQGLIHVDIRNRKEAGDAFRTIAKTTNKTGVPVLVQEMVKGSREFMAGLTRDAQFGPCVMFGLGGVFAEIFRDTSFRVAPIERSEALEMMNEIRARKMLEAFRGMPPVDTDRIADILMGLGKIGLAEPRIKEIDINPIIISGTRPVVVDALIVLNL